MEIDNKKVFGNSHETTDFAAIDNYTNTLSWLKLKIYIC